VYGLALLDVLQTVMITADAFHWFVYGFGNMERLDEPFLNSWDVPVLDSIISLVVQAFYCWRIYFLRKTMVIPILILLVRMSPTHSVFPVRPSRVDRICPPRFRLPSASRGSTLA
jgi:hypothetical protein